MPGLKSDNEVIQTVLDPVDAKTTDLGDAVWREPLTSYQSPRIFDQEI